MCRKGDKEMKLKGIEVINNFLTQWCENHDFDVVCVMGTDYQIDLGGNVLFYAPFYSEQTETIFREEIVKDFPQFANCDLSMNTIIAFFHEIGHAETENEWTDKEWKKFEKWREREDITDREYFRHPIEWRATEWACNYILEHTEEVAKLWEDICILFSWFYEINEVEIEEEENNICD